MANRRQEQAAATRRALIEAGARIFALHGYEGASVDAIAEEARVNKALVSYHFGGKQGLYSVILLEAIRAGREEFEPARDRDAPPRERLRRYVAAFARMASRIPHFPFMIVREEMSGGHHLEPEVFDEFKEFFLLDREILRDGVRKGVFRRVDPHAAHLSLVGALVFFHLSQPLRERKDAFPRWPARNPEWRRYVRHVQELILRGLETERKRTNRRARK